MHDQTDEFVRHRCLLRSTPPRMPSQRDVTTGWAKPARAGSGAPLSVRLISWIPASRYDPDRT